MRFLARGTVLLLSLVLLASHGADAARRKKKKKTPRHTSIAAAPRAPDAYRVTIPTADHVALAGSWHPVERAPRAPAVLLVHEFSRDRREWNDLVSELNARGLATLAIDLRGHGESLRKSGLPVKLTPRLQFDPNGFPNDVKAACAWLRERAPRVGVMGLSVGANLAVLATASGWADAGVAVSAATERFAALAGILPTTPRATLLVASEEDPGREAAARQLYEKESEPRKLIVVPGAAHNLALFTEHPETKQAAIDWLAERLGAEAPAPAVPAPQTAVQAAPTPAP